MIRLAAKMSDDLGALFAAIVEVGESIGTTHQPHIDDDDGFDDFDDLSDYDFKAMFRYQFAGHPDADESAMAALDAPADRSEYLQFIKDRQLKH